MAYIILPSKWTRQPQYPVGINWSNPLARGLRRAINPASAMTVDLCERKPITITGSIVRAVDSGLVGYFSPSSGTHNISFDGWTNTTSQASLVVLQRYSSDTGFSYWNETASGFQDHWPYNGAAYTDAFTSSGRWISGVSPPSGKAFNTLHTVGLSVSTAKQLATWDNETFADVTNTVTFALDSTIYLAGSALGGYNGYLFGAFLWERALSLDELKAVYREPWALYAPLQRRIYVGPSAGGGAISGTISESGTLASSFASVLLAKGTISESATLASSVSGKTIYPVSLEEVATLASTFSGGVLYSVSVEESGTLADSVTSIITINRTLSESATLDSGFTSSVVFSSTITEAATLASPLQGLGNFLGTFSESGTLDYSLTSSVESAGAYSGTILEAATLASSFASVLITKSTLAESATLADSYVSSWSGSVTYVESDTLAFTVSANTGAPSGGSTGGGGGIRAIPLGQDYTMMVKMVDIDGTGVAGLTLSFTASKAGGVFNSLSPSVVDRGSGWYAVTIDAADLDTEGEFVLTVEGTGAETQAVISQVALSTQDAVAAALTAARLLTLGQFLALK